MLQLSNRLVIIDAIISLLPLTRNETMRYSYKGHSNQLSPGLLSDELSQSLIGFDFLILNFNLL